MNPTLHFTWLRRDLRLYDHAAFYHSMQQHGQFQPIFIFDTDILAQFPRKDDWRLSFIADALCHMHQQLKAMHPQAGLLILHGKPQQLWPQLLQHTQAASIHAGEDYEPATQARDTAIAALCETHSPTAKLYLHKDHVVFSPREIVKDNGEDYKVYTPYSKAWRNALTPASTSAYVLNQWDKLADVTALQQRLANHGITHLNADEGPAQLLSTLGYHYHAPSTTQWDATSGASTLKRFLASHASAYPTMRDQLGEEGTSRISPYLRFGVVSIRDAMQQAMAHGQAEKWVNELIWREFYQMVLYYAPHSVKQEWQPHYQTLEWQHNPAWFAAWCEGRTGFPVVDAAMRQLVQTGWMHNRARMIVASFLTKDMHIDWRQGEAFFAQYLMDYELASNVGGWQWAASTGTDAQPYFRIFNPWLQSKKYDPDGNYIRRYIPELRNLDSRSIHEPHKTRHGAAYPKPVLEHDYERGEALRMFKRDKTPPELSLF